MTSNEVDFEVDSFAESTSAVPEHIQKLKNEAMKYTEAKAEEHHAKIHASAVKFGHLSEDDYAFHLQHLVSKPKFDPFGDSWEEYYPLKKPKKKSGDKIKSYVQSKYHDYRTQVECNEKVIFDNLTAIRKNKLIRDGLEKLIDIDMVEITDSVKMTDLVLGNYVNLDKVLDFQCNKCKPKKLVDCNNPHLEDETKWVRLGHAIYVFIGSNE